MDGNNTDGMVFDGGAEYRHQEVDNQQMLAPPIIESVAVRLETDKVADEENGPEQRQALAERQLRNALERSQKAVKALALLNVVSLVTATLLASALCWQRRRLKAKLPISR